MTTKVIGLTVDTFSLDELFIDLVDEAVPSLNIREDHETMDVCEQAIDFAVHETISAMQSPIANIYELISAIQYRLIHNFSIIPVPTGSVITKRYLALRDIVFDAIDFAVINTINLGSRIVRTP
jgi:hypothetical protein